MFTALSSIGRLVLPFLGPLMPGISPRLAMCFAAALVVLVAVGGPAGAVWLRMHSEVRAAKAGEQAACALRISEGARASAESLAHLLDKIAKLEDGGDAGKTAKQLCEGSPFCRNRGKK